MWVLLGKFESPSNVGVGLPPAASAVVGVESRKLVASSDARLLVTIPLPPAPPRSGAGRSSLIRQARHSLLLGSFLHRLKTGIRSPAMRLLFISCHKYFKF